MKSSLLKISVVVFSLFGTVAALAADFRGQMKVDESMELKGNLRRRIRTVEPGTYPVSVDVRRVLRHLTLRLERRSYRFKYDSDTSIPRTNGTVDIPAEESGQDYDLNYKVKTKQWLSKRYTRYETCYWGNVYGTRRVVYHNEVADHFFTLRFSHPAGETLATLKAKTRDVIPVIENFGRCRL